MRREPIEVRKPALASMLRKSRYERFTLCEAQESKEPERFLRWYRSLWLELNREC